MRDVAFAEFGAARLARAYGSLMLVAGPNATMQGKTFARIGDIVGAAAG